jgi:hypothetical protein
VLRDDCRYSTTSHVVEPPLSPLAASLCPIRLELLDAQTSNGLQTSLLAFIVGRIVFVASRATSGPHFAPSDSFSKSTGEARLAAFCLLGAPESDRLRYRWGPTTLRCIMGHLRHVRDRVLVRQSASPRLGAVSRFRYSEPVSSNGRGRLAGRSKLYRISAASELSRSAPIARPGILNDRYRPTGPLALIP